MPVTFKVYNYKFYIMEFTIKEDLIRRLQFGNLYSLEECKKILKEILIICSNRARKDFDELFTIDDYRIKVANQGVPFYD